MYVKIIASLLMLVFLGGCATNPLPEAMYKPAEKIEPSKVKDFYTLPAPQGGKVVAAVYSFKDLTGQRKPSDRLANISFAVTQGAETWVIKSLKEVGGGQWFQVVERVGLENLTKERQIIRQARQSVGDETQLKPMLFAGVILEGGITGYDSNTLTGGAGARYLGIGPSTQYRQDIVTVSMRLVSTQTGEILMSVSTTKTIVSYGNSMTFFRFFDMGTVSAEAEVGNTVNEPVNYAVRTAIETCVVELIKEGDKKGYWSFKTND